ncbi:hypothetical protein H311_00783 [Anncaliia algerae PRA109]|nr:hypothetical protein H311_00783 [Anncaliia algerae PRA109]
MDFYEPNEDTYFFIEMLLKDKENFKNKIILELGCGSGEISVSMKDTTNIQLISDINIKAVEYASKRSNFLSFHSDLLDNVNQKNIDIIIFNPPYVPSGKEIKKPIEFSYKGGENGVCIINKFVDTVIVKCFYLLLIQLNDPIRIMERIEKKGYNVTILGYKKILGEFLIVIKCEK